MGGLKVQLEQWFKSEHMIDIRKNTANCYHGAGYAFYCQEISWKLTILIMESHQGGTRSKNVGSMGSLSRDRHTWTVAKLTVAALAWVERWGGHPGQSHTSGQFTMSLDWGRNLEYLEQKPRQTWGEHGDSYSECLGRAEVCSWSAATLDHEWCVSVTDTHHSLTHSQLVSFIPDVLVFDFGRKPEQKSDASRGATCKPESHPFIL